MGEEEIVRVAAIALERGETLAQSADYRKHGIEQGKSCDDERKRARLDVRRI